MIKRYWVVLPLLGFIVLLGFLLRGLQQNPRLLNSALLDKPVPKFNLSTLTDSDFRGHPSILHVWATWCLTCHAEHPILLDIAKHSAIPVYGLAYKDEPSKVQHWLKEYGDPYTKLGLDNQGRVAIELGVYGAPETYLIDAKGVIRYRHVGALSHAVWQQVFIPKIVALRGPA